MHHYRLSIKGVYPGLGNKDGAMHVRWNPRMRVQVGLGHYGCNDPRKSASHICAIPQKD